MNTLDDIKQMMAAGDPDPASRTIPLDQAVTHRCIVLFPLTLTKGE